MTTPLPTVPTVVPLSKLPYVSKAMRRALQLQADSPWLDMSPEELDRLLDASEAITGSRAGASHEQKHCDCDGPDLGGSGLDLMKAYGGGGSHACEYEAAPGEVRPRPLARPEGQGQTGGGAADTAFDNIEGGAMEVASQPRGPGSQGGADLP